MVVSRPMAHNRWASHTSSYSAYKVSNGLYVQPMLTLHTSLFFAALFFAAARKDVVVFCRCSFDGRCRLFSHHGNVTYRVTCSQRLSWFWYLWLSLEPSCSCLPPSELLVEFGYTFKLLRSLFALIAGIVTPIAPRFCLMKKRALPILHFERQPNKQSRGLLYFPHQANIWESLRRYVDIINLLILRMATSTSCSKKLLC